MKQEHDQPVRGRTIRYFTFAISAACALAGCKADHAAKDQPSGSPQIASTQTSRSSSQAGAAGSAPAEAQGKPMVWRASGGGPQLSVSGDVEDLEKPFLLVGAIIGGKVTFNFEPNSPDKGGVSYKIAGSGVTGSGIGNYTINAQGPDERMLVQVTRGCINGVPGSCRTNTDHIKLKRVPKD